MKDPKAALGEWYSGKLQKGFRELLIGGFFAGAYIGFAGQLLTLVTTPQEIPLAFANS